MALTKEEIKEYDAKVVTIAGYKIKTIKIGEYYTAHMPMGDNPKDKKMFDELVYYNQSNLFAKTRAKLVSQIRDFIKEYRKKSR